MNARCTSILLNAAAPVSLRAFLLWQNPARLGRDIGLWLGLCLMLSTATLAGPPTALTPDIQLDGFSYSGGTPVPMACTRDDGSRVVLWHPKSGNDVNHSVIHGRIYDAGGQPVGEEFLHDVPQGQNLYIHSLACGGDGGFLAGGLITGPVHFNFTYQVLPFDASGNLAGPLQLLQDFAEGVFYQRLIARLGESGYLAIWTDQAYSPERTEYRIVGQRLDRLGAKVGQPSELARNDQSYWIGHPEIASNGSGEAVVIWVDLPITEDLQHNWMAIRALLLDASGQPRSETITVQPPAVQPYEIQPRASLAADGGFVVTWDENPESRLSRTFARSFDADGQPRTEVLTLRPSRSISTKEPSVVAAPGGEFVIAWHQDPGCTRSETFQCRPFYGPSYCTRCIEYEDTADGQDGSLIALKFDSDGTTDGRKHVLTSNTSGNQTGHRLTGGPQGDFLVVWRNVDPLTSNQQSLAFRFFAFDGPDTPDNPETPEEPAFQLDTASRGAASQPAVACGTGGFVGVWQGSSAEGQKVGVLGKVFDAAGLPISPELPLSKPGTTATDPAVARKPEGGFQVVWQSPEPGSTSDHNLFLRRFDAAGRPQGAQFILNTKRVGDQSNAALAVAASGEMLAVWQSRNQDKDGWGIYAQRLSPAGKKQGPEFQVNKKTRGDQQNPDVCLGPAGSMVVWQGPDGHGPGIFAQRYSAAGAPLGPEQRINRTIQGNQTLPAVACRVDGGFFVVYSSTIPTGQPDLWMRGFSAKGKPEGAEVRVHDVHPGAQVQARANLAGNTLALAWESWTEPGDAVQAFSRLYDAAGQPRGPEQQLTAHHSTLQGAPAICAQPGGTTVALWQEGLSETARQTEDDWGIFGRILPLD